MRIAAKHFKAAHGTQRRKHGAQVVRADEWCVRKFCALEVG
jgi:hypothetical protein